MKMSVEVLADLIIYSFLTGVDYNVVDLSDVENALDEYHLFRPVDSDNGSDKDGDWDYNDKT